MRPYYAAVGTIMLALCSILSHTDYAACLLISSKIIASRLLARGFTLCNFVPFREIGMQYVYEMVCRPEENSYLA